MAVRMLWKFVIGRAKTYFKNYNVIERAEKVMEAEKRAPPPRHPGTEVKFKVLIKEHRDTAADMEKQSVELMDRLKIVKVSSRDSVQGEEKESRPLPQMRMHHDISAYGYEEPKSIPEGRCTLQQALGFITNHQNDPSTHSISSIAEAFKMKPSDVENVINNFKAFQLHIKRDDTLRLSKSSMKAFGANKIEHSLFNSKFDNMNEKLAKSLAELKEEKK